MKGRERFLRAATGEPVDRPPVWLMRQAGRYLPEYRSIREQTSFLASCRDADLAAEISLQPFERFGMDGVVVFSDILLPLTALDLEIDFAPGPVVANPIAGESDLARLGGSVAGSLEATCSAIRSLKLRLGEEAAVIGFAGAPWTLAAYVLEQTLSRDAIALTSLCYRAPELAERLLARMSEITTEVLRVQIEAGADVVQVFDTWAGMLSTARYARFAGAPLQRALAALPRDRPPVIVYARAASHLAESLAMPGVDVVSLDWRTDFGNAARGLGQRVALQGNLDPAALHGAPEQIERAVHELIEAGRPARGHIVNLGHGVQPGTPISGVEAFVAAAKGA